MRVFCEHSHNGPLLFAHRGYHLECPENSLVAFERALCAGADVLEMDVHMTADGQIVVLHDDDGLRVAGQAALVAKVPYAEVAGWDLRMGRSSRMGGEAPVRVPRLQDVLCAFPNTALNVDVKQVRPAMVGPLLSLLASSDASQRVLLSSFSAVNLARLRAAGYPGPLGLSRWGVMHALMRSSCAGQRPASRGRTPVAGRFLECGRSVRGPACRRMQIPLRAGRLRLDTREVVERAHRLGYQVDYWVVDDLQVAERLLDLGADGIVTDNVPAMAALFARHVRTAGYRARWRPPAGWAGNCENNALMLGSSR